MPSKVVVCWVSAAPPNKGSVRRDCTASAVLIFNFTSFLPVVSQLRREKVGEAGLCFRRVSLRAGESRAQFADGIRPV